LMKAPMGDPLRLSARELCCPFAAHLGSLASLSLLPPVPLEASLTSG